MSSLAFNKCKSHRGYFHTMAIETNANGNMDLKLPDIPEKILQELLPKVSIVTITKNRGAFAGIMLYNWINIKYPREKLEWVVLDDTPVPAPDGYDLADYIPCDDPNIKYIRLDREYPVAEKRNLANEYTIGEIICHMDDDDYYFPDSVLAKVRIILQCNFQGVHSFPIGVYDMIGDKSFILDRPKNPTQCHTNDCAEATMAYRREYWEKNKFYSISPNGCNEGRSFIGKKFDKWILLHFMFNMVSITHTKNITGDNRTVYKDNEVVKSTENAGDFKEVFPKDFILVLENIKKILFAFKKSEQKDTFIT